MSEMVTLVCPEGAFDYPVSHGTREFYPYRADHTSLGREFGGPWLVDVPIEIYHHFIGRAGFYVHEPSLPPPEPLPEPPLEAAITQLEEAEGGEQVDAALNHLEVAVTEEREKVDTLVEEARREG